MTIEAASIVSEAPAAAPTCRVRGIARPTARSRIGFELWLPRDKWNGRYYQLGNGGFAGHIDLPSLAAEVARGNAAASTDTGHSGDGFDARWAAGHPERVIDYGHRSIKATSDAARALIEAYYGRAPARRYFAGCSNGGRQALMAAQRYPADWDGIIAGAPATFWTRQLTDFAAIQHRLRATPGGWISPALLPTIQRAALASCPKGSVDGGVAIDPRLCRFDPAVLLCSRGKKGRCLSRTQIESLRLIQAAGFEPSAAIPADWTRWIVNPRQGALSQLTFANGAFRYLLQHRPDWSIVRYRATPDVPDASVRRALDADSPDLTAFRSKGGRIISYFGWADAVISPRRGIEYYHRVVRRMGGIGQTQAFYRLFMVPGMTHCQGGPAAHAFGQSLPAPALRRDRHHDIRLTLEAWVEQGIAPDRLVAARYRDDDPAKGIVATRVLTPLGR